MSQVQPLPAYVFRGASYRSARNQEASGHPIPIVARMALASYFRLEPVCYPHTAMAETFESELRCYD